VTYRIYMAGAVDAHADLGRHWRKPLARAIRARGWEPAWPTWTLQEVDEASDDALAAAVACAVSHWDLRAQPWRYQPVRGGDRGPLHCLTTLATCDGAVFVLDGHEGKGTACERAFAEWIGMPGMEYRIREDSEDLSAEALALSMSVVARVLEPRP